MSQKVLSEIAAKRILGKFATERVPAHLLVEIARYFNFNRGFDGIVRFGMLGFRERAIASEKKMITRCVIRIEKLLAEVRYEFPFLTIKEWYMISLSCYWDGDLDIIDEIKKGETPENKKFIAQNLVSDFSRKVCEARIW